MSQYNSFIFERLGDIYISLTLTANLLGRGEGKVHVQQISGLIKRKCFVNQRSEGDGVRNWTPSSPSFPTKKRPSVPNMTHLNDKASLTYTFLHTLYIFWYILAPGSACFFDKSPPGQMILVDIIGIITCIADCQTMHLVLSFKYLCSWLSLMINTGSDISFMFNWIKSWLHYATETQSGQNQCRPISQCCRK